MSAIKFKTYNFQNTEKTASMMHLASKHTVASYEAKHTVASYEAKHTVASYEAKCFILPVFLYFDYINNGLLKQMC